MSRNNSYTAGNLLDYLYDQKYYKLIGIDLSGQTNTVIPQEIDFVGKLMAMFIIAEIQRRTILKFS